MAQQSAAKPGFFAGFKALLQGIGFIVKTPNVWPFAMVPIVLTIFLFAGMSWAAVGVVPDMIAEWDWVSDLPGWVGTIVSYAIVGVVVVLTLLLSFTVAQPLSGPAMERIVRSHEQAIGVTDPRPETSFIDDIGRSLISLGVSWAFGMPAMVILLILGFVMPFAEIILFPLKIFVAAMIIAWDMCDFPLTIRSMPIGRRVAFIVRNIPAVLGLSVGLALVGLVPCMLFIMLPSAVAGAAKLIVDIERWEAVNS